MTHMLRPTTRTNGTISNNTSDNGDPRFTTILLKPSDLSNQPNLMKQLTTIVNEAYKDTHFKLEKDLNVAPNSIFPGLRLDSETQLIEELPEESLIALMFDNNENSGPVSDDIATFKGEGSNSVKDKRLVAVASLKRWKGTVMKKYYKLLQSTSQQFPIGQQYPPQSILQEENLYTDPDPLKYNDWEIATCASINDKKYRGTGLVSRLNSILLDELRSMQQQIGQDVGRSTTELRELSGSNEHGNDDNQQSLAARLPIRLWVSALGGSYNVEYWTKRGYTVQGDGPDTAPPGVWGNAVDIQIWTLNKIVG